ncbi:MAG: endonuclease III [Pirellulales bacterium]
MARKTPPKADASGTKRQASQVVRRLKADFPDATCALNFKSPVQLLVATILSAQCTDQRVNIVTKDLFARYPTAEALAKVPLPVLEKAVQSTGFFRNKAKNIKAACQSLVKEHGGEVPQNLDALVALPGVGRKTANVVLGTAFGMATGVVVDTHVARISHRLGLTEQKDPVRIERDLMEIVPQREWVDFSHRMIHHGRQICIARKPRCEECSMNRFCPRIGVKDKLVKK